MHDFLIKNLENKDIVKELKNIGYDSNYASKGCDKFKYRNFKIYNLTCAQANILKQTALSSGADCATNKQVILGTIDLSNCILGGSESQLKKIAQKLQIQPFKLKDLGIKLEQILNSGTNQKRTKIMGILNITTNSFSDGGEYYSFDKSIEHLHELINDGADIIDIGAESTKPGAKEVNPGTQLEKLIPILEYIQKENLNIPVSIDTRSSEVADTCIKLGADIINDVSGFDYDNNMINILAQNKNTKIIIQHSNGIPETMQNNTQYNDLMDDIFKKLNDKVIYAIGNGIKPENIIIDPGIGFGKTREQNFEILQRWQELSTINCPVLIGLSRKSLLNMADENNNIKDIHTLALNSILINQNIDYIRVHNVKIHKDFINMINHK